MSLRIIPKPQHLEMIISKFIINLPSYQFTDDRIWIHLEKAFYYFIDQIVNLCPLTDFQMHDKEIKQFFRLLNEKLPFFIKKIYKLDPQKISRLINDGYSNTPIFGVIILNLQETKILMVEGHQPLGMYSIPKGKINQGESGIDCARRQLLQEVGLHLQLSQSKKIQINYSKNCTFYLCKIQQCNINTKVMKNSIKQQKNGRNNQKMSKQIKSLAWIDINIPIEQQEGSNNNRIRLNVATKKAIQKIKEQKRKCLNNGNNYGNQNKTQMTNHNGTNIKNIVQQQRTLLFNSSHSIDISTNSYHQKYQQNNQYNNNQNNSSSQTSIKSQKYRQILKKNPFDEYKMNINKFMKIFQ